MIHIGGNISVMVVEIDAAFGRVKLGTMAPRHVRVDRQEVHDRKKVDRAVKAYLAGQKK